MSIHWVFFLFLIRFLIFLQYQHQFYVLILFEIYQNIVRRRRHPAVGAGIGDHRKRKHPAKYGIRDRNSQQNTVFNINRFWTHCSHTPFSETTNYIGHLFFFTIIPVLPILLYNNFIILLCDIQDLFSESLLPHAFFLFFTKNRSFLVQ